MALLLVWLGVRTLPTNPLGWFLVLVGVAYTAGLVISLVILRKRFWESPLQGKPTYEEHGDRSLWFITLGIIAVFYLSPLEFLYLPFILPRNTLMVFCGIALVALGAALFVWARRTLGKNYSGHVSVKTGQTLVKNGPYRFMRHPAYAGYLLMTLEISLGYSSLVGMASFWVLLLPGMVYRMKVEERLLSVHFGDVYRRYAVKVKRIIPGIW